MKNSYPPKYKAAAGILPTILIENPLYNPPSPSFAIVYFATSNINDLEPKLLRSLEALTYSFAFTVSIGCSSDFPTVLATMPDAALEIVIK